MHQGSSLVSNSGLFPDVPAGVAAKYGVMSSAAKYQQENQSGVDDVAADFWESRPRRPRRGRKVAGVAAGIGNRYGVDPVLVRVIFIVAAIFGGFGAFLYVLGWLLLPEEGDSASPAEALFGRGRSSTSSGLTVFLLIMLFPTGSWALGGLDYSSGGSVLMFGLIAFGLYRLHATRGRQNRPARVAPPASSSAPAAFSARPSTSDAEGSDDATVESVVDSQAPGWDPLAADPLAWDLPSADPTPAPVPASAPPARRPRSKVAPVTVGLAILTAAVGTVLTLSGVPWFSIPHVIGMTLGVLGLGLVISAFAGGGRGLVWLAVPLAGAGVLLTSAPMDDLPGGGMGAISDTPRSAAAVDSIYESTMGSIDVDLTEIKDGRDEHQHVTAESGMGSVKFVVPADADVTYTCSTSMGSVDCLGDSSGGTRKHLSDTDYGVDGKGGQRFSLDLSSRMGSVELVRE